MKIYKNAFTFFLIFLLSACSSVRESELNQLRRDYLNGYYKKAFKRAETLSKERSVEAQYTLGYLYYYGYGTPQNTDAGYYWIEQAANQRYPLAERALSILRSRASLRHRSQNAFIEAD